MGIFDKIRDAIWGQEDSSSSPTEPRKPIISASADASVSSAPAATTAKPASTATTSPAPRTADAQAVDVSAMLDGAVQKKGQKLDWRHSIVDLMKAIDLDSSLSNRKELARELGYQGDTNDSATMNMWLHKAVMRKLSDNGGRVPPDLLD